MSSYTCFILMVAMGVLGPGQLTPGLQPVPFQIPQTSIPVPMNPNDLRSEMSRLTETVQNLDTVVLEVKNDLLEFQTTLERIESKVVDLETRVDGVELDITSLTEISDTEAEKVELLLTSLSSLEERVYALDGIQAEIELNVTFDYVNAYMTFSDAMASCTDRGGNLAILDTAARLQGAFTTNLGNYLWVGLMRSTDDDKFYWIDQMTEAVDINWRSGNPKEDETCGMIVKETQLTFKTNNCSEEKRSLCEFPNY